jgi:hypothetical protein
MEGALSVILVDSAMNSVIYLQRHRPDRIAVHIALNPISSGGNFSLWSKSLFMGVDPSLHLEERENQISGSFCSAEEKDLAV